MTYLPEFYRYALAFLIALLVFFGALSIFNRFTRTTSPISSFSLDTTITEIKTELQRLENMPGVRLGLLLSEVKIDLMVEEEQNNSGNIGFGVPVFDEGSLKGSEGLSVKDSSTVSVVLIPPRGTAVLSGERTGTIHFAELLAATRTTLQSSMDNEPKLDAKSIEVKLNFVLVSGKSQSAGIKAKIVSAGVSAEQKSSNANTITLKYVNPAYIEEKGSTKPVPP